MGIHLEPDIPRLLDHFAQSIAWEIGRGEVARLILPVGPKLTQADVISRISPLHRPRA